MTAKGFSLLELILAVAIFSLGSVALATLLIDANISTKLAIERTQALFYAKEGIEAVRAIRDNDWATLNVADGANGLTSAGGTWVFSGASDDPDGNSIYTRIITVDTVSTSTKSVISTISWDLNPARNVSISLETELTNWRE